MPVAQRRRMFLPGIFDGEIPDQGAVWSGKSSPPSPRPPQRGKHLAGNWDGVDQEWLLKAWLGAGRIGRRMGADAAGRPRYFPVKTKSRPAPDCHRPSKTFCPKQNWWPLIVEKILLGLRRMWVFPWSMRKSPQDFGGDERRTSCSMVIKTRF